MTARPTTLLLVEDIDPVPGRVEAILREAAPAGFAVAHSSSLADALAYLEAAPTDCVVVDLDLSHGASLAIVETIATRSPHVALVALADCEDDRIGVPTVHAGPVDVLSARALDAKALVGSIRHAILLKHLEASTDEVESIGRIGRWEVDLATRVVSWSHELYRLLGFDPDHEPGYGELTERIHPDDRASTVEAFTAALDDLTPFAIERRLCLPDGSQRWVCIRGRVEVDGDGLPNRLLGSAQDVTDHKVAAAALQHQELHDFLTGLPNRRLLVDRLEQALNRLARVPLIVGVINFDVDRFKVVNDDLGYAAGDRLLRDVAVRLQALIRPADTLARADGDEFVVLCEGLADEAEAVAIADRICAAMTEPFRLENGELVISVSAGIALATQAVDAGTLLADADAALDRAKRAGRGRSAMFAETMRPTGVGRLDTETALRHAISDGDLRVHYQPVVNLLDGQVLGHEALVRWAHPARGLLGPDEFISVAEESGLIVPLGAWVLREACMQAKRFQRRDPRWPHLTMSVNLSGAQLNQAGLIDLISSALRDAELSPQDLQLEMTESVLMDDAPRTITVLQSLHELGVQLSVDDFGTGYSSLAYLRRFPVDVLKIDRTFVGGLGKDLEDSAIVAAVVNLADTLGFTTVAEGVETELQRECLIDLGCSRAQGYLFSRPAAADDAEIALDRATSAVSSRP